jgi:hypothetical protein
MLTASASWPALVDQITRTRVSISLSNVLPHGIPSVSALRSSGCRPIARNADKAPSFQLQARRKVNFPKGVIRLRDRQSGDHHVSVEVICRPRRQGVSTGTKPHLTIPPPAHTRCCHQRQWQISPVRRNLLLMTQRFLNLITCDHPDCLEVVVVPVPSDSANAFGSTERQTEAIAESDGWLVGPHGRDLCPKHR